MQNVQKASRNIAKKLQVKISHMACSGDGTWYVRFTGCYPGKITANRLACEWVEHLIKSFQSVQCDWIPFEWDKKIVGAWRINDAVLLMFKDRFINLSEAIHNAGCIDITTQL